MIRIACLCWLVVSSSSLPVVAQDKNPSAAEATNEVNAQATRLEGELGKYKDASIEAADIMVQLVDLYHENGRVFGLIRVGQRFVSTHASDQRHQAVMLKLIDGLEATARNEDFSAACRQFLVRYPQASQCASLEIRLAEVLDRLDNRDAAGDAHRAVWTRSPGTPVGRDHGIQALIHYASINNKNVYSKAAELGQQMLTRLPADRFAEAAGWQSVNQWRRGSEWAKSNAVATALLKKGIKLDRSRQRLIHMFVAENYGRLGQWANAAQSYKTARGLGDSQDVHYQLIQAVYNNAAAKPNELAPLVNEYTQKYPERPDRFTVQSQLALKYSDAKQDAQARDLFGQLLDFSSRANSAASYFYQLNGTEPNQLTNTANRLKQAIGRNPNREDVAYLRYVLAFSVYRDQLKQIPSARQVLRDLISQSPTNDSYTQQAIDYLLGTAESDSEFQADVALIVGSQRKHMHLNGFRGMLSNWAVRAASQKELKPRTRIAQAEANRFLADAAVKTWAASESNDAKGQKARDQLIATGKFSSFGKEMSRMLLHRNAYYLRHYAASKQRPKSATAYGLYARAFPKDFSVAVQYLAAATDYGPPELAREAAMHVMKLQPESISVDLLRRLMIAADLNKDPNLAKQAYAWIRNAEKTHGLQYTYAYTIGDVLAKYELEPQAIEYWREHIPVNRDHYDSRYCADRLLAKLEDAPRQQLLRELVQPESDYHGYYSMLLADMYLKAGQLDQFEQALKSAKARQDARPMRKWGVEDSPAQQWVDQHRSSQEIEQAVKLRVLSAVRDLSVHRPSAAAALALLEFEPNAQNVKPIQRLLQFAAIPRSVGNSTTDWDRIFSFVQSAVARKEYSVAATLASSMLANINAIDDGRRQAGRALVAQSYSRLGAVGLTIDNDSAIAPLLQAALYLRLGDKSLALETYDANRKLFDDNRDEVPIDLLLFVCESRIAGGGDENHDYVEDTLRNWMIRNSEAKQYEDKTKAAIQLLLARNFAQSQRYDIARSEFSTVINRFPNTPQALEAQFGIGEAFMAQKVFDQAEVVFEKLAASRDSDVVVRAEFLRGVLAYRRGDKDEARDIFRVVLDRVPSIELANQALFNLAAVYGDEERYIDQLNLLRTVGRLGRSSKRTHTPGLPLSIVVQDSDLGISRGHNKIPVIVTTVPGGDSELIHLTSGGAGKGLFRVDLETRLGPVAQNDRVLQITGRDIIRCDYPEEFKREFRRVPLSDVEIHIAADAELEVASSQIIDEEQESFSERLEREEQEREQTDQRVSQSRPANQIKPGNVVYFRVKDADRDLSDEQDEIVVKLVAESGDQVQARLTETESHSGEFEGTAQTGELPAGALASDTAIEHSPVMAIDQDPQTYWMSEPDGSTPKWLTVDMKDLKLVSRVRITTPEADRYAPVRGELLGSNDGQFWFRIASNPPQQEAPATVDEFTAMKQRVYAGNHTGYASWSQVVSMSRNSTPVQELEVETLNWTQPEDLEAEEQKSRPHSVLWDGKLVQPREGAARILVRGMRTALWVDGRLELPLGPGNRTVDVWLESGSHDVTIFSATTNGFQGVSAAIARADHTSTNIAMMPFRTGDFDLSLPAANPAQKRAPVRSDFGPTEWTFAIEPLELRYVRLNVDEYLGEAVAINYVEITGEEDDQVYIPTEADLLTLSTNNTLEVAGGDVVTATYTDEFTRHEQTGSRLLSRQLTATYFNADVRAMGYDFVEQTNGQVNEVAKRVMRVEPGERFIIEIVDYDHDQTGNQDQLTFDVAVNDGEPIEMTAVETEPYSGIFRKEVDTSAEDEDGKIQIKQGDRIYVRYIDSQNTFPGHAVPRETVVLVNQPTDGQIRILETRVIPGNPETKAPARFVYRNPDGNAAVSQVAFEAPLTIEVIDPDAAKDSRSRVTVNLQTSAGATVSVDCVISSNFWNLGQQLPQGLSQDLALEEGRFVGQVILQLGGKDSPVLIPVTAEMPRNLIGGPTVPDDESSALDRSLVTRVLNLTGKDQIQAVYQDEIRVTGDATQLTSRGRLISNGELACTDRDYEKPVNQLHVGEKLFLVVHDPDQDASDERDQVKIEISCEFGERESVTLYETLAHSGIFTGSFTLASSDSPTAGNIQADDPLIECYFGDTVQVKYLDQAASTEEGKLLLEQTIPVVIGTDGLVAAFSKSFSNETLAVETRFHIAESYFELFKSHKDLDRDQELKADLEAGRRVLREVMEDFPDPKYVPRVAYLLGQFAQELEQWEEAIESYRTIIDLYPEHSLAPDAQYKLAQSYEERGDFDEALEAYVTLAATYPQSPLIANVMIRISDHFYKSERFDVAGQVGQKFLERFESHKFAPRIAFRIGQCFYKAKAYAKSGKAFDDFAKRFPDDQLCSDSLFWSGESFRMASNTREAFRRYNRCRWDFPASEAAKYSRGRLALPEMLQQFEAEARSVEDQ